jgi:exopolysaccharide biosynthesis predicted pyruvyltransferase EpsI
MIVDNNYGKIGNFHKTWTLNNISTRFVTDISQLDVITDDFEATISKQYNASGVTS